MGGGDANFHHGRGHGVWMWYHNIVSARAPFLSKIWSSYASDSLGFYRHSMIFSLKLSRQKSATKNRARPTDLFFSPRPPTTSTHYITRRRRREPNGRPSTIASGPGCEPHRKHQCKSTSGGGGDMIHGGWRRVGSSETLEVGDLVPNPTNSYECCFGGTNNVCDVAFHIMGVGEARVGGGVWLCGISYTAMGGHPYRSLHFSCFGRHSILSWAYKIHEFGNMVFCLFRPICSDTSCRPLAPPIPSPHLSHF